MGMGVVTMRRQVARLRQDLGQRRPATNPVLEAQRRAAERSLYEFVKRAWHVVESQPFIDNWHIGMLCEHLQAVTVGEIENLLANIPPGCSKSLLTCGLAHVG